MSEVQLSAKYKLLKKLVKLAGIKKQTEKSASEIVAIKIRENAKNRIPQLRDSEIDVSQFTVMGFPVLRMTHRERCEKANLFLIGGGMVSTPRPASIKKALRIAKESGVDLFIPYYPVCTEYPVSKAYEMVLATYKFMLKGYQPENISLLGTSSGGNLALGMIAHMNAIHSDLPRPGHIIAISPGTCPITEEEKERMRALDEKDVAISAKYMLTAEEIMRRGQDNVPDYMIFLQTGDFSDCPKVTFIYGTDEVLYAVAPSFEEAMKRYHVDYQMNIGEGMFHCYPVFPICEEAKAGWNLMIRLLKEGR